MHVDDNLTTWRDCDSYRLDTRIDHGPLAQPVSSHAIVTVNGAPFHAIGPLDIRPHHQEDIVEASLVERSVCPANKCVHISCLIQHGSYRSPNALLGGVLLVEDIVGALPGEGLIETKLTAGRERCGVGLRFVYRVAQVCNPDARDHRRIAKDGWRAGEVVEESNSGAKKNRRDVDVDFVEEPSIQ